MVNGEPISNSELSGAIIAAGRGERLRAAVGGIPKPLVELNGESLLARQVRLMLSAGVRPIQVIINSETARTMDELALYPPTDADVCVRDTANSMESLFTLGERLFPGRFVLMTVDAIIDRREFQRFIERALELTDPNLAGWFDGALGVVKWRGDRHPLFVKVADDGLITAVGEQETETVTAGVYLLTTQIFEYAAEARKLQLDAMRRFLSLMVDKGMRFAAIALEGVIDLDEGSDLEQARLMFAR
jgi:choline kinase